MEATTIILPISLFTYGAGLINSPALTAMLVPFPEMAGTAGAAMGATLMLGVSVYTFVAAIIPETSMFPLSLLLLVNAGLLLLAIRFAYIKKVIRF